MISVNGLSPFATWPSSVIATAMSPPDGPQVRNDQRGNTPHSPSHPYCRYRPDQVVSGSRSWNRTAGSTYPSARQWAGSLPEASTSVDFSTCVTAPGIWYVRTSPVQLGAAASTVAGTTKETATASRAPSTSFRTNMVVSFVGGETLLASLPTRRSAIPLIDIDTMTNVIDRRGQVHLAASGARRRH